MKDDLMALADAYADAAEAVKEEHMIGNNTGITVQAYDEARAALEAAVEKEMKYIRELIQQMLDQMRSAAHWRDSYQQAIPSDT